MPDGSAHAGQAQPPLNPHPPQPTQQPHGGQWITQEADYLDLPDHLLIAGSFQSTQASGLFDAHGLVPDFDGIHIVQQIDKPDGAAWLFIRCDGEAALADPASILSDDLRGTLLRYAGRLTLK
jgi:hypothetical protein